MHKRQHARALTVLLTLLAGNLLAGCEVQTLEHEPSAFDEQSAFLQRFDFEQPLVRQQLPVALREISGIVALSGSNLLGNDDNRNTVWLLDTSGANAPREYLRSHPVVEGDYEDITLAQGEVYLTNSHGELSHVSLPSGQNTSTQSDSDLVDSSFTDLETPVINKCNFEGLVSTQTPGEFYLACKYLKYVAEPNVHIYRFSLNNPQAEAELLVVDVTNIREALGIPRLRPFALHWLHDEDRFLILAGKERVLLEIDRQGHLLAWRRLRRDLHRQAEGLTVNDAGQIVIADEADGRTPMLTVYAPFVNDPS